MPHFEVKGYVPNLFLYRDGVEIRGPFKTPETAETALLQAERSLTRAKRKCLCCNSMFNSENVGNRICIDCLQYRVRSQHDGWV